MAAIMKKKKRVLVFSDYVVATGFSIVTTNIIEQVRKEYRRLVQFDIVAGNWFGDKLPDDYEILPAEVSDVKEVEELRDGKVVKVKRRVRKVIDEDIVVYSAYYTDGKEDVFGRNAVLSMLKYFDYNLLFMIQDLGVVLPILEIIKSIKKEKHQSPTARKFKVLYYFPVDGPIIHTDFKDIDVVDKLVAYTEFGKQSMQHSLGEAYAKKIPVILHGIDTGIFRPIEDKDVVKEFRESFFKENAGKEIIINVNRNDQRKDIPSTLMVFAQYKRRCVEGTEPFLYLHMQHYHPQGYNLKLIADQLGLIYGEDYMFMPQEFIEDPPDAGFMNMLYNASDIYITTTMGEGFGLTILEAMAAGIPVIAPYHTSIKEINDYASTRGVMYRLHTCYALFDSVCPGDNIIRKKISIPEFVETLIAVSINEFEENEDRINSSINYAQMLNWNRIGKKWIDVFKEML